MKKSPQDKQEARNMLCEVTVALTFNLWPLKSYQWIRESRWTVCAKLKETLLLSAEISDLDLDLSPISLKGHSHGDELLIHIHTKFDFEII